MGSKFDEFDSEEEEFKAYLNRLLLQRLAGILAEKGELTLEDLENAYEQWRVLVRIPSGESGNFVNGYFHHENNLRLSQIFAGRILSNVILDWLKKGGYLATSAREPKNACTVPFGESGSFVNGHFHHENDLHLSQIFGGRILSNVLLDWLKK